MKLPTARFVIGLLATVTICITIGLIASALHR